MTGPRRVSANALSQEVGVAQPTLSRWLREAGNFAGVKDDDEEQKAVERRPDDWTAQEKLGAVMEAAGVAESELGAWLRRKGLTREHLRQWRAALEERASVVFSPRESRASSAERKRVKELERELKRKDKALAETAALLVLQGKMQALWGGEDEPTRQTSDAPSSKALRKQKGRGRG